MTTFEVKYRNPGCLFWRKLKKVKGDGFFENNIPVRFFILEDETRIEIPMSYEFQFSKERFMLIHQRMEQEAGQSIPLNKK